MHDLTLSKIITTHCSVVAGRSLITCANRVMQRRCTTVIQINISPIIKEVPQLFIAIHSSFNSKISTLQSSHYRNELVADPLASMVYNLGTTGLEG
jgi:hypothetical protein